MITYSLHSSSLSSLAPDAVIFLENAMHPDLEWTTPHFGVLNEYQKFFIVKGGAYPVLLAKNIQDAQAGFSHLGTVRTLVVVAPDLLCSIDTLKVIDDRFSRYSKAVSVRCVGQWSEEVLQLFNCKQILKTLSVSPPNLMTPQIFAETFASLIKDDAVTLTVHNKKDLEVLSMGGVLAVSAGSSNEPRLLTLHYAGDPKIKVLVAGKGVTFDSGGLSLKRSDRMHEMKFDMVGGAEALSVVLLCARMKLPLTVTAVVPACENLPSGTAFKPGDVITSYAGKTIEVLNTDAEGRLILADALAYGIAEYKPDIVVSIATLTSSIFNALGSKIAGYFSSDENLAKQFEDAAKLSSEYVWRMPLHSGYQDELKSKVADLRNVGKQRCDGIFAALFLKQFTGDIPWLHLDMAGVAWKDEAPTGETLLTVWNFLKRL
ncbi:MAG TPA: M17 family metallopeptidase [Patescibacteria group bacterium]|nr:M17 family metallopeptidase [Patescibacteria group bacterium]